MSHVPRRVKEALCAGQFWSKDALVTLAVHIDERTLYLRIDPLEAAMDLLALTAFSEEALRQRGEVEPNDGADLVKRVKHAVYVLNNVSYHAYLTGSEREMLYLIAEEIEDHIDCMTGARA